MMISCASKNYLNHRWEVLRRYSDFFLLHQHLTTQFPKLFKIPFPGKKTFGNLERNVVAKRQKMLNQWFVELLALRSSDYPGLYDQVQNFTVISTFTFISFNFAVLLSLSLVSVTFNFDFPHSVYFPHPYSTSKLTISFN